MLVYEPEFANVLKQSERQGNTLSAVLRQAWDTDSLRTLTKNSPAKATGAHISIIGHITSEELHRYLTATESANGFANRFFWVAVQRSKLLPFGGQPDPRLLKDIQGRLGNAIASARPLGEIRRTEEADEMWAEVYPRLSSDRPGLAGCLLGRAEAHTMRLALIYALLDKKDAIGAEHLMAALALWDYAERSVLYVFGDSLGNPLADDLLQMIRRSPNGVTRTEITNYLGRSAPSDAINHALALLLRGGLARFERQESGGRPTERWLAGSHG